jgi:hypothetical protein
MRPESGPKRTGDYFMNAVLAVGAVVLIVCAIRRVANSPVGNARHQTRLILLPNTSRCRPAPAIVRRIRDVIGSSL